MSQTKRLQKTAATAFLVGLGALVPYVVPQAGRFRLVSSADLARAAGAFRGDPRAPLVRWNDVPLASPGPRVVRHPPPSAGPATPVRPAREAGPVPRPAVAIEDPSNELVRFFERLEQVGAGGAGNLARITHLGDSPLTGDLISGEARALLQDEFGDGGPGFVLAARPWGWYGHEGIGIDANGWTARSPLLEPGNGGHHGLGLVSFTGTSPSARSEIRRRTGTFTRAEVTFTAAPGGGGLLVSLDGGPEEAVPTSAPERGTGRFLAVSAGGASRVALRARGDGPVTVYGVALETDGPGLVYDAVGANGASIHALNLLDEKGWGDALALRHSDLVILNYGTNESSMEGIGGPRYEREYAIAIGRVRRALPEASILVMAPMDRGVRLPDGSVGTLPAIRRLVAAQRRIARENGCAFYDTFAAMGGEGTMGRWYASEARLVTGDLTHTTKAGSDRVARLFVGALRAARADRDRREAPRRDAPAPEGAANPAEGTAGPFSPRREAALPPS